MNKLLPCLCLAVALGACATNQPETPPIASSTEEARTVELFAGLLVADSYRVLYDQGTDVLAVEHSWWARFGKSVQSVPLADLDLSLATAELVPGGAYRDTALVEIPVRPGKVASVDSWPPSADAVPSETGKTTATSDEVFFHCGTVAQAREAISELRKLAATAR